MKKYLKQLNWEISTEIWPKKVQLKLSLIKNKSKNCPGKLLTSFTSAPRSNPKLNLWKQRPTFICIKNWKIFFNRNSRTYHKKNTNKIQLLKNKFSFNNHKPFLIQNMLNLVSNSKNQIQKLLLIKLMEHVFWTEC